MLDNLHPTVEPIDEDPAWIEQALTGLNLPSLIMTVVHMTGDLTLLQSLHPPRVVDVVEASASTEALYPGGYTTEEAEQVFAAASKAIQAYRDAGCVLPSLDGAMEDALYRFMLGGDEQYQRYLEFMREEIALDGVDRRGLVLDDAALQERAAAFPVVVIGGGLGGVLAGIRIKEAGIPFTIIEKNPGIGGTWYENRYPGCRVDVPGHSYSYSFEPNHDWSSHFPLADEIRAYFEGCAQRYGLLEHTHLNTEVSAARYNDEDGTWTVETVNRKGQRENLKARAVISAVGQLNRPRFPDIPGIDSFTGPVVHSGAWPKGLDLSGQRVAVIGSGASAFQIIPELAKTARPLTVFQRSPAWMFPNPAYHTSVSDAEHWALRKLPYYSKWYRFWLLYTSVEGVYDKTQVDPDWQQHGSVSAANEAMRGVLAGWIESQVTDPALLSKVMPDYPPFGKRILQDNGSYLEALQRDNVELITEGITAIEPSGLRTADGELYEVDAIVCATGFYADRFLFPMEITGRDGIGLNQQWQETDGRAYLGITVPNFPNLFCIYGPNTNLVVAGSIAHNAESQVNYILRCIRMLLERDARSLDCRQDVHDRYNDEVDKLNEGSAWGAPSVENWYKNQTGRVTANLPFRIVDYWQMTRSPDPDDYIIDENSDRDIAAG